MNRNLVRYVLGFVLIILSLMLLLPVIVAFIYRENDWKYFLLISGACGLVGGISSQFKPKNSQMLIKEGFISCALTWILMSIIGCLPFVISGQIPNFTNALFETVSGFTTTGATILGTDRQIEDLSHSMLFWRSFTNWAGGMGILVFILAVVSQLSGQSNMHLMKAESPGPVVSKLIPKLKNTAVLLYVMYFVMSFIEFILLIIGKMPLFDAITVTFSTAGTGGFSVLNEGIMAYNGNYYQQAVITAFMVLFGVNFSVYYLLICRKFSQIFKFEELRWYLIIYAAAVAAIGLNLTFGSNIYTSKLDIWHHAAFQVATYISSTGFATQDFDKWPEFSKAVLLLVAFIGACAGSTGGGLKVSRVIILWRSAIKSLKTLLHPNSVVTVKMDGKTVKEDVIRSTSVYFSIFILVFMCSVLLISLDNMDFTTNFTAVLATLNNMGPGLNLVGPTRNFYEYSDFSKYVLIFDMLAGRLELLPMLMLFEPFVWKKKL
ncbi:MAG: TrkH family potassium uptake protein [Clostridia bacterium]|nr:TrkH family potassium uptake protein [Clostridia bacterium]